MCIHKPLNCSHKQVYVCTTDEVAHVMDRFNCMEAHAFFQMKYKCVSQKCFSTGPNGLSVRLEPFLLLGWYIHIFQNTILVMVKTVLCIYCIFSHTILILFQKKGLPKLDMQIKQGSWFSGQNRNMECCKTTMFYQTNKLV